MSAAVLYVHALVQVFANDAALVATIGKATRMNKAQRAGLVAELAAMRREGRVVAPLRGLSLAGAVGAIVVTVFADGRAGIGPVLSDEPAELEAAKARAAEDGADLSSGFLAIRPICEALGLDWSSQRKRINRDHDLKASVVIMTTPSAGGSQQTVCLPLSKLNGWLFGVDVARVRPELRERMSRYRAECFDVLARHFGLSQPEGLAALSARMRDVELSEQMSFRHAQACSSGMHRRRKEKRQHAGQMAALRAEVQLALALIEGGAA